jgi:threonine-phosphate decarboxylase
MASMAIPSQRLARADLFPRTSHSPSLAELVGYERAAEVVDFCFIANPYFPTPSMLANLSASLPSLIKGYPSSDPVNSSRYLAATLGVEAEDLLVGNGATEIIVLVNDILVDRIAVPVPTFGEYIEKLRDPSDAVHYQLPPDRGYELDLGEYLAWVRRRQLRSLLVVNPGNPTGQLHSADEMVAFMEAARDMELVVVDESFLDFAPGAGASLIPYADRFPNLLVVRSLSKNYGVPGLRLGFCYSRNRRLLDRLRQLVPTWNLNVLAEYFLTLLPDNEAEYRASLERVRADVGRLAAELSSVPGLFVYPTGSNFILFRIDKRMTATELQRRLLDEHGMYVRDCSNKVGLDGKHVRIASRGRQRDAALALALRSILAEVS